MKRAGRFRKAAARQLRIEDAFHRKTKTKTKKEPK
jgi:hypothetical protein